MANLNANFENFVAHVGKHGFDVGKDNFFTAAPGMILPIWKDILNAGERLVFNCDDIVRTNPMMKPASLHIRQKVDLFFVPAPMIFTAFGQVLFQTDDNLSSLFDLSDTEVAPQLRDNRGYLPLVTPKRISDIDDFNSFNSSVYRGKYFECFGKSQMRLFMHLGYNPFALISDISYVDEDDDTTYHVCPFSWNPSFFPWAAATYQAIYQNWYRNDDWEVRDVVSYNLDALLYDNSFSGDKLFTLRYHQRVGDYFSSIKRSPVMSSINLLKPGYGSADNSTKVLSQVNSYLSTDYQDNNPGSSQGQGVSSSDKDFGTVYSESARAFYSPSSIRTLFAVEKYLRITGRASKNYDSQVLAHFGYDVPRDVKHEITFIGGFDGFIDSKQVISTAGTSETELGEQAGYGEGRLSGKTLKFTAPCHGFVMAVYYIVPEFSYPQGILFDKLNSITNRLDFFFPEYDKLGKQPIFDYECFGLVDDDANKNYKTYNIDNYVPVSHSSKVLGWQYRYEHFKRQYNTHSLAFYRPYLSYGGYQTDNDWASWIVGKNPFDIYTTSTDGADIDVRSLLISPHDLDRIFVQHYAGDCMLSELESPWLIFQSDPIMVAMRIDAKKTSAMSPTGEPDLF